MRETATFRVLYVFLVLVHERRKVLHFNITDSPSATWTAQQLAEAFPYANPPRYLLRDRNSIYGLEFVQRTLGLGLEQKLIASRAPWQNAFAERFVRSIKQECLSRLIFLSERHLRTTIATFVDYYRQRRNHQGIQNKLIEPPTCFPKVGRIRCRNERGGMLHYYYREAA
jgi:putative transposase